MGSTVYIIRGGCGTYDGRRSWMVCAHLDKAAAIAHVKRARARADQIYADWEREHGSWDPVTDFMTTCSYWELDEELSDGRIRNEHDPEMSADHGGTHYSITRCPLVDPDDGMQTADQVCTG